MHYNLPRINTVAYQRSFFPLTAKEWNCLLCHYRDYVGIGIPSTGFWIPKLMYLFILIVVPLFVVAFVYYCFPLYSKSYFVFSCSYNCTQLVDTTIAKFYFISTVPTTYLCTFLCMHCLVGLYGSLSISSSCMLSIRPDSDHTHNSHWPHPYLHPQLTLITYAPGIS